MYMYEIYYFLKTLGVEIPVSVALMFRSDKVFYTDTTHRKPFFSYPYNGIDSIKMQHNE